MEAKKDIELPINTLEISIVSLHGCFHAELKGHQPALNEFMYIFRSSVNEDRKTFTVGYGHKNNKKIRTEINCFVQKFKHILPELNNYNAFFKSLEEDEVFIILPNKSLHEYETHDALTRLLAIKSGKNVEKEAEKFEEIFHDLFQEYFRFEFDKYSKKTIGELNKDRRVCRFCGLRQPATTFKNEAHAISEALGNKQIIQNEECDSCNKKFGDGVEQDIIEYVRIFGVMNGVKGKIGVPTIRGRNFELSKSDVIEMKYSGDIGIFAGNPQQVIVPMQLNRPITLQNIYKALCKYALSVVDSSQLKYFKETLDWLNDKKEALKLPKIGFLKSIELFSYHPRLVIYQRKGNNSKLPYMVGELQYTNFTFVFIIPFCQLDQRVFTNENEYKGYWEFFKHFNLNKDIWKFEDFSDTEARNYTWNIAVKNK